MFLGYMGISTLAQCQALHAQVGAAGVLDRAMKCIMRTTPQQRGVVLQFLGGLVAEALYGEHVQMHWVGLNCTG